VDLVEEALQEKEVLAEEVQLKRWRFFRQSSRLLKVWWLDQEDQED
jgi:hypothetical protein